MTKPPFFFKGVYIEKADLFQQFPVKVFWSDVFETHMPFVYIYSDVSSLFAYQELVQVDGTMS